MLKSRSPSNRKNEAALNFHFLQRVKEGFLLLTLLAALFLLFALGSYHHQDPSWSHAIAYQPVMNLTGRVGAWLADFFLYIFGLSAYFFPLAMFST